MDIGLEYANLTTTHMNSDKKVIYSVLTPPPPHSRSHPHLKYSHYAHVDHALIISATVPSTTLLSP